LHGLNFSIGNFPLPLQFSHYLYLGTHFFTFILPKKLHNKQQQQQPPIDPTEIPTYRKIVFNLLR